MISENGAMVFFTAGGPDANVYEWNEGSLSLISTGNSPLRSELIGVSAGGSDVFFTTFAPLIPENAGGFNEIYDARVGGGFSVSSAPVPCGSLEACRGTPATSVSAVGAASATFSGAGNLAPVVSPAGPVVKPKPKSLTRAQKLSKALKACHAEKNRHSRVSCKARARRQYGPVSKMKKSAGANGKGN